MSLPANKLVFVGGMGAGKTTAVRAISDVEPVSTEMPLSQDAHEHQFVGRKTHDCAWERVRPNRRATQEKNRELLLF